MFLSNKINKYLLNTVYKTRMRILKEKTKMKKKEMKANRKKKVKIKIEYFKKKVHTFRNSMKKEEMYTSLKKIRFQI